MGTLWVLQSRPDQRNRKALVTRYLITVFTFTHLP